MTRQHILAASILLNVASLGSVGYLVGMRHVSRPDSLSVDLPQVSAVHNVPGMTVAPATSGHIPDNPPAPVVQTASSFPITYTPSSTVAVLPTLQETVESHAQPGLLSGQPSAASLPENTVSGRTVQSNAPGNFIHFRGMQVAVAEDLSPQGSSQPSLAVDVTPTVSDGGSTSFDANAAANSQEIQVAAPSLTSAVSGGNEPASASPAISFPGKSPSCRPDRSVFSSEDDLFRTKWGWAAYNAAQQEAAKESADQSAR